MTVCVRGPCGSLVLFSALVRDGHDPYRILSDDSIEQLLLDNILDGSDCDSHEPIDLEYVACLRRMRLRHF
jgi:hypothetical protein